MHLQERKCFHFVHRWKSEVRKSTFFHVSFGFVLQQIEQKSASPILPQPYVAALIDVETKVDL